MSIRTQTRTRATTASLILSVIWFGAKVNDPSHDSLPSFEKAYQYAVDTGTNEIIVPPGTYYFKSGDFTIETDGIQIVCPNGVATIVQETWGLYGIGVFASHCWLENLRFEYRGEKTRIPNTIPTRFYGELPRNRCSAFVIAGEFNTVKGCSDSGFVCGWRVLGGNTRIWQQAEYSSSYTSTSFKLNDSILQIDGYYEEFLFKAFSVGGTSMVRTVEVTGYDAATNTISYDPVAVPATANNIWYLLLYGKSDGNVLIDHDTDRVDFGRAVVYCKDVYLLGTLRATRVEETQASAPHANYFRGNDDAQLPIDRPSADNIYALGTFICTDSPNCTAFKFVDFGTLFFNQGIAVGTRGGLYIEVGDSAVINQVLCYDLNSLETLHPPVALMLNETTNITVGDVYMSVDPDFVQLGVRAHPNVVSVESIGKAKPIKSILIKSLRGDFYGTGDVFAQYGIIIEPTDPTDPPIEKVQVNEFDLRSHNGRDIRLARLFDTQTAKLGPNVRTVDAREVIDSDPKTVVYFEDSCNGGRLEYDSRDTMGGYIQVIDEAREVSSTANNLVWDRGAAGNANLLKNPSFSTWGGGTSFTPAADTVTSIADDWKVWRLVNGYCSVSRQAGFCGTNYACQVQRDSGSSITQAITLVQEIPSDIATFMAGGEVSIVFAAQAGANYSGTELRTSLFTGTGVGESITTSGYPTGGAQTDNQNVQITTTGRFYTVRHPVAAGVTALAIVFQFKPEGTAGADDWVRISPVVLVPGATAGPYRAFIARP